MISHSVDDKLTSPEEVKASALALDKMLHSGGNRVPSRAQPNTAVSESKFFDAVVACRAGGSQVRLGNGWFYRYSKSRDTMYFYNEVHGSHWVMPSEFEKQLTFFPTNNEGGMGGYLIARNEDAVMVMGDDVDTVLGKEIEVSRSKERSQGHGVSPDHHSTPMSPLSFLGVPVSSANSDALRIEMDAVPEDSNRLSSTFPGKRKRQQRSRQGTKKCLVFPQDEVPTGNMKKQKYASGAVALTATAMATATATATAKKKVSKGRTKKGPRQVVSAAAKAKAASAKRSAKPKTKTSAKATVASGKTSSGPSGVNRARKKAPGRPRTLLMDSAGSVGADPDPDEEEVVAASNVITSRNLRPIHSSNNSNKENEGNGIRGKLGAKSRASVSRATRVGVGVSSFATPPSDSLPPSSFSSSSSGPSSDGYELSRLEFRGGKKKKKNARVAAATAARGRDSLSVLARVVPRAKVGRGRGCSREGNGIKKRKGVALCTLQFLHDL